MFHSHSIGTAAELVLWSPIGDQYVLSVGKDVSVYDVSVSKKMIELRLFVNHDSNFMFLQSGDLTVTFDVGSLVNCFAFIQVKNSLILVRMSKTRKGERQREGE